MGLQYSLSRLCFNWPVCCVSGCSSDVTTLYQPSPTAAWILKTEGEDCALSVIKFLLLSVSLEDKIAAPLCLALFRIADAAGLHF